LPDDRNGLTVRLDPRAPLVLDTRELGRRPGSQRHTTVTAPAPADLGIEVLRVPEGASVELDLRLEAVMEGVLVTGSVSAELEGECVRCLETIREDLTVDFQELFVYEESDADTDPGSEEGAVAGRLQGDLIDLEPLLRNTVVLELPLKPLCREDCPGLCIECGARLADDPDHQHDEPIDPRWAALRGLTTDDVPSRATGSTEE
jgi:uncharacterized protein